MRPLPRLLLCNPSILAFVSFIALSFQNRVSHIVTLFAMIAYLILGFLGALKPTIDSLDESGHFFTIMV